MSGNRAERQALLARVYYDVAAAHSAVAVLLGHRLGLYRSLRDGGPATAAGLARRAGTDERFTMIWLLNQAASGYVTHDAPRFRIDEAQADVLFDPSIASAFELAGALGAMVEDLDRGMRTGKGVASSSYAPRIHEAIGELSRNTYEANLVAQWLPGDLADALERGISAADIGCGYGWTTTHLAKQFVRSRFTGIDTEARAIDAARRSDLPNVTFEVGDAAALRGSFDAVMSFDLLHDVVNPSAVASSVRRAVAEDGAWLIVEPRLAGSDADLMSPHGRFLTALSLTYCSPISRAGGGEGHGMTMKRAELIDIVRGGGFDVREIESDVATVLDARPAR